MIRHNQKNLLFQIAGLIGVASASALLSLPAMALTNFNPKSFAQPFNNSFRTAQSKSGSGELLLAKEESNNPATNTGSKPTTIQTERGTCEIPPSRPTGGNTRKRLQATRNCNPGSSTVPSNTNNQQTTPSNAR